jgi:hypothetical protein
MCRQHIKFQFFGRYMCIKVDAQKLVAMNTGLAWDVIILPVHPEL